MEQLLLACLPFVRIILIVAAVIVCVKATKALIKVVMIVAAGFFLWPYIVRLLEFIF